MNVTETPGHACLLWRPPSYFLNLLGNLFVKVHALNFLLVSSAPAQAVAVPHGDSVPSEEMHPDQNGIGVCPILALEKKCHNKQVCGMLPHTPPNNRNSGETELRTRLSSYTLFFAQFDAYLLLRTNTVERKPGGHLQFSVCHILQLVTIS